jgi:hypothetical protein
MAIDKPKKKKPGFSFEEMDNFETQITAPKESTPVLDSVIDVQTVSEEPKKRGRKPGTKLSKSYKFQLVPGAVETQLLITIPVELHEKIKEKSQQIGETVKEYVAKKLANAIDFKYEKEVLVTSESAAVALVAEYPWRWNDLQEEYRTPLVFQTLINTNPDWLKCLNNVSNELIASITREQWIRIVTADYNAIKKVPQEYLNYVLKSIKELLNEQGNGEDNSNQYSQGWGR